jgi:glycosyltransferase involved in cell wall biosynthesis
VVPVAWAPPGIPHPAWRQRNAVPEVETDHGVEIIHPRYLSFQRASSLPGVVSLQRHLFWRTLCPFVSSFAAGGGQIVHAHTSGLPGCMVGRTGQARLVISMHDNELFDVAPAAPAWRHAIVDSLRRADAVVYVSPLLMRLGLAAAGPHNACVIPAAIDIYDDVHPPKAAAFTVSTAARLIERKKIHVLIQAFAALLKEVPSARLVIMGDGTERIRLERLALSLGVAPAVEFTGTLAHRDVVTRIGESHVFALPSVRESLGTVYFEAMSQGVPVVATAGEGIADFITDGEDGFLVQPDDPTGLFQVLRALQGSSDLLRRVADHGRVRFERSKVRWTDSLPAHIALFHQLTQDRGLRRQ